MNRTATMAIAMVVMGSVAMGCQTLTGKSAGQNIDDAGITSTVKSRLVGEKMSNLTRVEVDTSNGVVFLPGVVDSEETKQRAEQIAREAGEVQDVVNNLQVESSSPDGSAGSPSGDSLNTAPDGSIDDPMKGSADMGGPGGSAGQPAP